MCGSCSTCDVHAFPLASSKLNWPVASETQPWRHTDVGMSGLCTQYLPINICYEVAM